MSSALVSYESFLVQNVQTISTLESTLRSLTWFLPGRFRDAELASEALSATLNVTSMYHDTLLAKVAHDDPRYKPILPPSPHTRYTRAWTSRNTGYKWAARMLELIQFTQLLVEMGLRRRTSPKAKWRGIVLLELVKAVLRLLILKITRRPLLSPPIPEREFDPASLPPTPASAASSPTLAPSSPPLSPPATPDHLRNNHVPLPVHPLLTPPPPTKSIHPVEDYLLPKALTPDAVRSPLSLMKPLSGPLQWTAEILFVLRPLVYAALLSRKQKSTRPLTALIVLELLSRNLRRYPASSASLESSEYARRDRAIFWYLLRGSIWESYTRPKAEVFVNNIINIPVIGVVGALLKEWMPLLDEYYYYSAP